MPSTVTVTVTVSILERIGGPGTCAMSYDNLITGVRDGIKQRA